MKKSVFVVAAASVALSGCGLFGDTFRDRGTDYQLAEERPVIEVPAGLDKVSIGEVYPIPAIPDDSLVPGDFQTPRPSRPSDTAFEKQVKIQTLGDKRWALVQASPSEVWPRLRNVLTRNAIPAARADAPKGELETVWVNFSNDEEFSHRFRFQVEQGVQFNTTEVSVLQNQATKGDEEQAQWLTPSSNDDREKEMLRLIAEALAGDIASGSVSLLAQSIGGEAKVELLTPRGENPYLLIKLSFERAWASVAYSANRGGFTTRDQDRSAGTFYLDYQASEEEEEDDGWFSWLSFGSDDDESSEGVDYLLKAKQGEQGIEVRITDADGNALEPAEAVKLLKTLRSNLS